MIESQQDRLDKRQLKRWKLVLYLRVFDFNSGDLVGHLVDVHTDGMMLISDHPIAVDSESRLWVDVPVDDVERERLRLDVLSVWCKRDVNPDFFVTGFQFVNQPPETLLKIQLLIDDLMF